MGKVPNNFGGRGRSFASALSLHLTHSGGRRACKSCTQELLANCSLRVTEHVNITSREIKKSLTLTIFIKDIF